MTNFNTFDMLGKPIDVDDIVAGAFSHGSSAALRVGIVIELKVVHPKSSYAAAKTPNYYIKVRWVEGWGRPDKPSLVRVIPNEKSNFLKVELDGIN